MAFSNNPRRVMPTELYSPGLHRPIFIDSIIPVKHSHSRVNLRAEEDNPPVPAPEAQRKLNLPSYLLTDLPELFHRGIRLLQPHGIHNTMDQPEASRLSEGRCPLQGHSCESARGNVRVYLAKPGVLESQVPDCPPLIRRL